MGNEKHRIVDVRPVDAYTFVRSMHTMVGFWKVKDAVGHIKGARTLSASWTDEEDWVEIVRGKGTMPNHRIVVYGYYRDDSEEVAERFAR
ncbi:MAG: rhodanese-like domain-containing protein [Desulfobacterales bacterium]